MFSWKKPFKQNEEASILKKFRTFKFKILKEHFRENQPPLRCSLTSPLKRVAIAIKTLSIFSFPGAKAFPHHLATIPLVSTIYESLSRGIFPPFSRPNKLVLLRKAQQKIDGWNNNNKKRGWKWKEKFFLFSLFNHLYWLIRNERHQTATGKGEKTRKKTLKFYFSDFPRGKNTQLGLAKRKKKRILFTSNNLFI